MRAILLIISFTALLYAESVAVQWAAFAPGDETSLVETLNKREIPFYTQSAVINGKEWIRIRSGLFSSREEALWFCEVVGLEEPFITADTSDHPLFEIETLKPNSFAGMIPVIFIDTIPMPDSCDRPLCFNHPVGRWQSEIYPGRTMPLFTAGFFDPKKGCNYRLFEGYNQVLPMTEDNHYILVQTYTHWGPGAYHKNSHRAELYLPGSDTLKPFGSTFRDFVITPDGFSGTTRWNEEAHLKFALGDPRQEIKYALFSHSGEMLSMLDTLPEPSFNKISLNSSTISHENGWNYELPLIKGEAIYPAYTLYYLGNGIHAVHRQNIVESDDYEAWEMQECCSICDFDTEVYLFNENGFIEMISFPASNGVIPFFLRLHEDPCSA